MKTFSKRKGSSQEGEFQGFCQDFCLIQESYENLAWKPKAKQPPNLNSRVFDSIAIKQGKIICKENCGMEFLFFKK
jgi:hypothetical protein